MLSSPGRRIAIGSLLIAIILAGLALTVGRAHLRQTHRHVVVEVSNVDGIAQVFIDCNLALRVQTGESWSFDLGWLEPDDDIYLSTTSLDGTPAWGFHGTSNGEPLFNKRGGDAELARYAAEAHGVVFARAFSASGEDLGTIGCQPPGIVTIEGYALSPDDEEVARVDAADSSYRQENRLYDWIDVLGKWSLAVLALAGVAAAAATPLIRRIAWAHKGRVAGGGLALIGAGAFALDSLPTIITAAGLLLLLAVAALLLLEGAADIKHGRGSDAPGGASRG